MDPRLLRRARPVRRLLLASTVIGTLRAVSVVLIAGCIAHGVGTVFAERELRPVLTVLPWLGVGFVARALLTWLGEVVAARAAVAVKSQFRREVVQAYLRPEVDQPDHGTVITLVSSGLDDLDAYFSRYLPQLVLAIAVPLVVGVAIAVPDLVSAVIIALTLPLIPVFMILVGWTTEKLTGRRWRVQARLAHHFADLIAGLPTLRVFGRARAQAEGLRRSGAAHRVQTLATLRIALLSALVLELLSMLAVAIVAVVVGLRVLAGGVDLTTALFVLILAPEAYLPLRQVGVHYHDGASGAAAARAALDLTERRGPTSTSSGQASTGSGNGPPESARGPSSSSGNGPPESARGPSTSSGNGPPESARGPSTSSGNGPPGAAHGATGSDGVSISCRGVSVGYPGAAGPVVRDLDLEVATGSITVLTGPSGCGKSTVLAMIMGWLSPDAGRIRVGGTVPDVSGRDRVRRLVAWVGQEPALLRGTVADNVRLGLPGASDDQVVAALRAAGVDLDIDRVLDENARLSSGEQRRVALARAWLKVRSGGASVMILDEPTAGLDEATELEALATLRRLRVSVLMVSHRPAVLAAADRVVRLGRA